MPRDANVIMIHAGRCGSKVLSGQLGQHSKIFWDGEIFSGTSVRQKEKLSPHHRWCKSKYYPFSPFRYMRELASLPTEPVYGFEVQFWQLKNNLIPVKFFFSQMKKLDFNKVILLKRKNYLRNVLSYMAVMQTKKWHLKAGNEAQLTAMRLDPDKIQLSAPRAVSLLTLFQIWDKQYDKMERALAGHNVLPLTYEDHIAADPRVAYRRVCEFLSLEAEEASVPLTRTNPFQLKQMIVNFDEVAATLKTTEYAWMLED